MADIERLDGAGGHLYRVGGDANALSVPGVTTIITAEMPEPERLTNWRRRQDAAAGVRRALRLMREIPDHPHIAAPGRFDAGIIVDPALVSDALDDADQRQGWAMDAGSAIHDQIAAFLDQVNSPDVCEAESPETQWHVAAARVIEALEIETWQTEVAGVRMPLYGGTIDLLGFDGNGDAHIVDWKTTAGDFLAEARYREGLQIAAYAGLEIPDPAGGDGLVSMDVVSGHVARLGGDGRVCLCEVDVAALWLDWVQTLDRFQAAATRDRRWFIRRTRRLG